MRHREDDVSEVAGGICSGVNPERWVDDHGDCLIPVRGFCAFVVLRWQKTLYRRCSAQRFVPRAISGENRPSEAGSGYFKK